MGNRYRMADNTTVDTENVVRLWHEASNSIGSNVISRATGTQGEHQRLYKTRGGRYWLECWSQRHGSMPQAEWLDDHEAARWMLHNGHELPADLAPLAGELIDSPQTLPRG